MNSKLKRGLRRYGWNDFGRDCLAYVMAMAFMLITVIAIFLIDTL